jgi:hypothetical protein
MRWWCVLVAAPMLWGCAAPMPGKRPVPQGDLAGFLEADVDMAEPQALAVDMARPVIGPGPGGSVDMAMPVLPSCLPVVNEVATGTTTSALQEFVELYNPCSTAVSLSGFSLVYRSAAGTSDVTLITDIGTTIDASGFLLFSGSGYYTSNSDGTMKSGLKDTGGAVGLRDSSGGLVDSVGWGAAANALVQGTAGTAPGDSAAPGKSLARASDGVTSGDNATDFSVTTDPTPRAANVIK